MTINELLHQCASRLCTTDPLYAAVQAAIDQNQGQVPQLVAERDELKAKLGKINRLIYGNGAALGTSSYFCIREICAPYQTPRTERI